MIPVRLLAAAVGLFGAAPDGCGVGPGNDEGDVSLTVTRDYGSEVMLQKSDSIRESDTVIRLLDRNADISTRYGGGFIQSIDGLAGTQSGGRSIHFARPGVGEVLTVNLRRRVGVARVERC